MELVYLLKVFKSCLPRRQYTVLKTLVRHCSNLLKNTLNKNTKICKINVRDVQTLIFSLQATEGGGGVIKLEARRHRAKPKKVNRFCAWSMFYIDIYIYIEERDVS